MDLHSGSIRGLRYRQFRNLLLMQLESKKEVMRKLIVLKSTLSGIAIFLFLISPVRAQYMIDQHWGVLADMAEYDFETRDGILTARWEIFNEALILTDWTQNSKIVGRFVLNPSTGELVGEGGTFGRIHLESRTSGDLIVRGSMQRFIWRDAFGKLFRAVRPGDIETIVPLGPTVAKVRTAARLVSSGKIRPVTPDFRRKGSASSSANEVASRPVIAIQQTLTTTSQPPPAKVAKPKSSKQPTPTLIQVVSRPPGIEPRIALIIGNSRYGSNLGALENPGNDARLIAGVLEALGFDVELLIDGNQKAMKRAISRLGERLGKAGSGSTGLFYFAGHGMQSRGQNYLIPVGAAIEREADIYFEAVAADTVLSQMEDARAATNIVILDACRNTPILRSFRSGLRGLARMEAPNGSFISYSTAPGSVAYDGDGRYSPFADALSKELNTEGQPIEITFRNVRKSVLSSTDGKQTPWDSSSLTDTFLFNP